METAPRTMRKRLGIYIYASDDAWDTSKPIRPRDLTARCHFYADGIAEARKICAQIEAARYPRGRRLGAAAFWRISNRENDRLVAPQDTVPELPDYLH